MSDEATGMLIRGLVGGGAVRVLLVEATALAERTREAHGLGADGAVLAAEAIVAVALGSAHIKGEESLVLQIQGERPRVAVYVDLTAEGALRARLTPPDLRLSGGMTGVLLMVKELRGREVYRGATAIEGRSIQQALAAHLCRSDQVDAFLGLDVRSDPSGRVTRAAGFLLERLPEDADAPSLTAEAFVTRYGWLKDADPREVMTSLAFGSVTEGDAVAVLEERELVWRCRCSVGRIEAALVGLGVDELLSMADEDHGAEVTCHFCNRRWTLTEARLRELASSIAQA